MVSLVSRFLESSWRPSWIGGGDGSRAGMGPPRSRSLIEEGGRSGGRSSGTLMRQFCSAVNAAPLTRWDVSGGLPSVSSPATQTRRASITGFEQQQPVFNTRAAAYRTHSFGSARSPLINAIRASFQRLQSTVPRYSIAATRAFASASLCLILPATASRAHRPGLALQGRKGGSAGGGRAERGEKSPGYAGERSACETAEHLAKLGLA